MLKFYKNLSKNIIICYAVSFLTLLLILTLSIIMYYNAALRVAGTVNTILIAVSVIIIAAASVVSCRLMQDAVISAEKELRASNKLSVHLKRIGYTLILMAMVDLGISFVGALPVSFLLGIITELRYDNFPLFCTIVKIPLFILFLVFLVFISRYTGLSDTATKAFNPHLMLIALIFSLAFMLPGTVRDYMYDNTENRGAVSYAQTGRGSADQGKQYYNLQTVFSQNIDLYKNDVELNEKFSLTWTIISILAVMAVQIAVAMTAYNMGRKAYYAKHPRMSEEELDSYLPDLH